MVAARDQGQEGMGSYRLRGTVSVLQDEKSSGDGWWRWLLNNVNVLNELCT